MDKQLVLDNIKRIRRKKGVKQEALAEALGIRQPSYSLLERGKNEISLDQVFRLAEILEVSVLELFAPPEDAEALRKFASLVSRLPAEKKEQALRLLQLQDILVALE